MISANGRRRTQWSRSRRGRRSPPDYSLPLEGSERSELAQLFRERAAHRRLGLLESTATGSNTWDRASGHPRVHQNRAPTRDTGLPRPHGRITLICMDSPAPLHPTRFDAAYQRLPDPEGMQTCKDCGCWDECAFLDETGWPCH